MDEIILGAAYGVHVSPPHLSIHIELPHTLLYAFLSRQSNRKNDNTQILISIVKVSLS